MECFCKSSKSEKNYHIFTMFFIIFTFLAATALPVFATQVEAPVFNMESGRYHHPLTITLQCATPGASIYYTTDGSTPDANSTLYNGTPILVANHASGDSLTGATDNDPDPQDSTFAITFSSMTIKAIAVKQGMENSDVVTETYVVDLVDATFNIPYADPPPAGGGKHLLDVYQPYGKTNTPVLLFIHGGAWKQGDKNIYLELGNTFAGYYNATTVIANYQLSADPWNAIHPTHVQDVALAFRWVHEHIAEYGGDSTDISIFGQSAGGHLISLLATDSTYLDAVGQKVAFIKRAIPMSGAYDLYALVKWPMNPLGLSAQEVLEYKALCLNAFGSWDQAVLDAGSPAKFINRNQPPFFIITLNETSDFKDMPGFPEEAENFYNDIKALNGPPVQLDTLSKEDIPPEILGLDFPSDADGHYQEIYAINTKYWDSRSTKMVAGYLDLLPQSPTLLDPPDGGSTEDEVTFTWQSSKNSTYYHLQVSANSNFSPDEKLIFNGFIGDTTWTLKNFLPNTQYFWRASGVSAAGESEFAPIQSFTTSITTGVQSEELSLPQNWKLSLYPNPFNGAVRISVQASVRQTQGRMLIYDVLGREIEGQKISVHSGENDFTWTPASKVPSGIYMIRFDLGQVQLSSKVLFLK